MPLQITKKQPKATVTKQKGKSGVKGPEQVEEIQVGPPKSFKEDTDKPHATVAVDVGFTKNLGNFESLRVGVHLSMPCEATDESIHETFDFCKTWCDLKMADMLEDD